MMHETAVLALYIAQFALAWRPFLREHELGLFANVEFLQLVGLSADQANMVEANFNASDKPSSTAMQYFYQARGVTLARACLIMSLKFPELIAGSSTANRKQTYRDREGATSLPDSNAPEFFLASAMLRAFRTALAAAYIDVEVLPGDFRKLSIMWIQLPDSDYQHIIGKFTKSACARLGSH